MKCKMIRDDIEVSCADPAQVEGQTHVKRIRRNGRMVDRLFWNNGAVLSHPQAFLLVQQGMALPADDVCREAANMTTEGLAAATHALERLNAGIHPDEFAAYDMGYISGYNPDGTWKPGPKGGYEEYCRAIGVDPDELEEGEDV